MLLNLGNFSAEASKKNTTDNGAFDGFLPKEALLTANTLQKGRCTDSIAGLPYSWPLLAW
jgi:hypothetical protein